MEIDNILCGLDHGLNAAQIPAKIGQNKLPLSRRAISDLIEKYSIDILMNRYGQDKIHPAKKGKPYDVIIKGTLPSYINIKTELQGQLAYDAIWICSESVLRRMPETLKEKLYYLRLEYSQNTLIKINRVSYAGPVSILSEKFVIYDKSNRKMMQGNMEVSYKIATHYNGKHVHLLTNSFTYF